MDSFKLALANVPHESSEHEIRQLFPYMTIQSLIKCDYNDDNAAWCIEFKEKDHYLAALELQNIEIKIHNNSIKIYVWSEWENKYQQCKPISCNNQPNSNNDIKIKIKSALNFFQEMGVNDKQFQQTILEQIIQSFVKATEKDTRLITENISTNGNNEETIHSNEHLEIETNTNEKSQKELDTKEKTGNETDTNEISKIKTEATKIISLQIPIKKLIETTSNNTTINNNKESLIRTKDFEIVPEKQYENKINIPKSICDEIINETQSGIVDIIPTTNDTLENTLEKTSETIMNVEKVLLENLDKIIINKSNDIAVENSTIIPLNNDELHKNYIQKCDNLTLNTSNNAEVRIEENTIINAQHSSEITNKIISSQNNKIVDENKEKYSTIEIENTPLIMSNNDAKIFTESLKNNNESNMVFRTEIKLGHVQTAEIPLNPPFKIEITNLPTNSTVEDDLQQLFSTYNILSMSFPQQNPTLNNDKICLVSFKRRFDLIAIIQLNIWIREQLINVKIVKNKPFSKLDKYDNRETVQPIIDDDINPPYKAYLSNLPLNTSKFTIQNLFPHYEITFIENPNQRPYAFVEFSTKSDLLKALKLQTLTLNRRCVKIQYSKSSQLKKSTYNSNKSMEIKSDGMKIYENDIPNYPPYHLIIPNIPLKTDKVDIHKLFPSLDIIKLSIGNKLNSNNQIECYCLVTFETRQSLIKALSQESLILNKQKITVELYKNQTTDQIKCDSKFKTNNMPVILENLPSTTTAIKNNRNDYINSNNESILNKAVPLNPPFKAILSNLHENTSHNSVKKFLSLFNIKSIEHYANRGYCIVEFKMRSDLIKAIDFMDPQINGIQIKILLYTEENLNCCTTKNSSLINYTNKDEKIDSSKFRPLPKTAAMIQSKDNFDTFKLRAALNLNENNRSPSQSESSQYHVAQKNQPLQCNNKNIPEFPPYQAILSNLPKYTTKENIQIFLKLYSFLPFDYNQNTSNCVVRFRNQSDLKRIIEINNPCINGYQIKIDIFNEDNRTTMSTSLAMPQSTGNPNNPFKKQSNTMHPIKMVSKENQSCEINQQKQRNFQSRPLTNLRKDPHSLSTCSLNSSSKSQHQQLPLQRKNIHQSMQSLQNNEQYSSKNTSSRSSSYQQNRQSRDRKYNRSSQNHRSRDRDCQSGNSQLNHSNGSVRSSMTSGDRCNMKQYKVMLKNMPIYTSDREVTNLCKAYGCIVNAIKILHLKETKNICVIFKSFPEADYTMRAINRQNLGIEAELMTSNEYTNQQQYTNGQTFDTSETGPCVKCEAVTNHRCSRCGYFYCSEKCQQLDWRRHSLICLPPSLTK